VIIGLLMAVVSAICYGIGSVLQASAAQTEEDTGGVDARLLARLAKRGPFLAGLALDLIAFVAQFISLRYLAVFVVQAVQAGNLAVTAVVAIPLLGARLARREWAAIGGVCGGLVLLAMAAGSERQEPVKAVIEWSFLAAAGGVLALGLVIGRFRKPWAAVSLGFVAGLGFGIVALCARALTDLSPSSLVTNPAAYGLLAGGFISFLFYATALQRHKVTTVTAAVVIGETVLPALVGVLVLGDGTRPGFVPVAVIGFVISVAGAVLLARFGEPEKEKAAAPREVDTVA